MKDTFGLKRLRGHRLMQTIAALLLGAALAWPEEPKAPNPDIDKDHAAKMAKGLDIFKKHVRPVLTKSCLKCHGGRDEIESEFDLSDRKGLLKGGTAGPAFIPGNAKDSLLYKLITHTKEPYMPHQSGKLSNEVIAHIAAWIDNGAPYDAPLVAKKTDEPSWTQKVVAEDARQFWSFQPLRRAEPPAVKKESWCRTSVDRFILAKLQAAGLEPNPPVSKRQLIRRAYFDLLGLPPSPEEVEAFVNDTSAEAYSKLLDRLLASPHYGERWGRHWLDLVRFAESHGFEHDYDRPSAYHYRDFVIRALNDDLPYDTFVKWQLAGDEFEPENNLALTATGYLAAGVHSTQITKKEVEKHRYDEMDDMLATTGTAMLGLTIGCARCHDHKYDPFPQADYYRLVSTFTTTVRSEIDLNLDREGYQKAKAAFDKEHEPYAAALKKFEAEQLAARLAGWEKAWAAQNPSQPAPPAGRLARLNKIVEILRTPADKRDAKQTETLLRWYRTIDPEWQKLNQAAQDHLGKAPKPNVVKALISSEGLPPVRLHTQGEDFFNETYFLRRGDPEQKEGAAAPGYLQVLMRVPDKEKHWPARPPKGSKLSYRRTALAGWITDVEHGAGHLLARVIVNRLWQYHMGRGIVATPSDFGARGERPTHPELLDWLAEELIKNGWRLKPIHKLIMSSSVYLQTSEMDEAKARVDRDNQLFWRRPQHRLEAEVIRDAMLAVSGALDPKMFGPGTLDEGSKRRSIYFTVKRSKLLPMMVVFDAPEALVSVGDRPTTTIAPQALLLMNNPQVRGYAKSLAKRIAPDAKTTLEEAVQTGYLMALARPPSREELADSAAFVKNQMESYGAAGKGDGRDLALADFCQVLMCLNEFVYVE